MLNEYGENEKTREEPFDENLIPIGRGTANAVGVVADPNLGGTRKEAN